MSVTLAKTAQSVAAGKAQAEQNRRLRANDLTALAATFRK
ncbi:hypothetical protein KGG93_gp68 [Streptomyces phage Endor2]|uniref:Uncharacterized protein n=1 Tax=Streptomyces phage Endor2 TaxID=2740182 RepID=A0A7G4AX78_9CAUD|nr:hypothetical protein KGG93_gp68 [Streptomyces phage Endor2]QMP84618.1 hypothetical protein HUN44_00074 [Streptomyces phage Endor2]